jgi:voltage-gated potassium channel
VSPERKIDVYSVLKRLIEKNDTRWGRAFDLSIQGLIVVSLISFSIETLPELSETTKACLNFIEIVSVLIFTVEYLARLVVSDRKIRFIFSFFGIIDLVAILPFYLGAAIDLRSVRILRLLRLFRTLKIMRNSKTLNLFYCAFKIAREEILIYLVATIMILYLSAIGIYYCERGAQPEVFKSVFHSLWWAVTTLTTVGYGDVYPVTVWGRILTFFVLMLGLGVVSMPAALFASALTEARKVDLEAETGE